MRAGCLVPGVPHCALAVVGLTQGPFFLSQTDLRGCACNSGYGSIVCQMMHNILKSK